MGFKLQSSIKTSFTKSCQFINSLRNITCSQISSKRLTCSRLSFQKTYLLVIYLSLKASRRSVFRQIIRCQFLPLCNKLQFFLRLNLTSRAQSLRQPFKCLHALNSLLNSNKQRRLKLVLEAI